MAHDDGWEVLVGQGRFIDPFHPQKVDPHWHCSAGGTAAKHYTQAIVAVLHFLSKYHHHVSEY
jgi:hypothetical protein